MVILLYLVHYAMFRVVNEFWSALSVTVFIATGIGYPTLYRRSLKLEETPEEKEL